MTMLRTALRQSMQRVTKDWTKAKRHADKRDRLRERQLDRLARYERRVSIKSAAYSVMERAYLKASANDTLPANARQIMYAARPFVLELTGGRCWKNSSDFTQRLLPDYMAQHDALGWDVVFDARGRFVEPHTDEHVDLGTLDVRRYLNEWTPEVSDRLDVDLGKEPLLPSKGPAHRFGFALFIEKEGFNALLERSQLAARYDLAIMSTKGMSTTAARLLVERLSDQGVTILVARDFDVSGFSIVHTLRSNTRRYQFRRRPKVVDLGLRLDDAATMGLEREPVDFRNQRDPRIRLRECGATEDECDVLAQKGGWRSWTGERIELNAMDSAQFIEWLEERLTEAGVTKVIPRADVLATTYRRAVKRARVQRTIDEIVKGEQATIDVPADLAGIVKGRITGTADAWDHAVWTLAVDAVAEDES